MTSATFQGRDRQPTMGNGGEVAFLVVAAVALGVAAAAVVGLGVAGLVFGGGWVWPGHGAFYRAAGAVLSGHSARGLTPSDAAILPGPVAIYSCVAVTEIALIALAITGGVLFSRYRRPSDARGGMATRSEARTVLGVGRLHQAREIIRPDLYGKDHA